MVRECLLLKPPVAASDGQAFTEMKPLVAELLGSHDARTRKLLPCALLLGFMASHLGAATADDASSEVITNIARLWSFPEQLRGQANPVKLSATVTYYDPAWGLLWIQDGPHGLFCAPKAPFPQIAPGQQIEISAATKPGAREIVLAGAQYRVLSETGLPAPWIIEAPLPRSHGPDNVRCRIQGYVRRSQSSDAKHLRFEIVSEDMVVRAVLLAENGAEPLAEDSLVRVTGVLSPKFDRDKKLLDAQMVIPRIEDVELLQPIGSNSQFATPLRAIAALQTVPTNQMTRVQGVVEQQEPGVSLTIQDGTGRVTAETWQTRAMKPGERVEAVGFPLADGPELRLQRAIFRPIAEFEIVPTNETATPTELVLVQQVRQLSPEEASKGHLVKISGVVTWADAATEKMFLQDSSGGIAITCPKNPSHNPVVGDWLEVRGVTGDGGYAPVILNPEFSGRGVLKLPAPRMVSLDQALAGMEESQWVEMRGYVRSVTDAPGLARMEIVTSRGSFAARLRTASRLKEFPGAIVRLRGVCEVLSNSRRQLTGVQLWVPNPEQVIIEEVAPKDPFSIPLRTIASLSQFSAAATLNRRARIAGVVTWNAGRAVYLQDGADGLLVLTENKSELRPGDRVEAAGFPGREGHSLVLRDALFIAPSRGEEPVVVTIDPLRPLDEDLEGRLASADGIVLQKSRTPTGLQLTLQNARTIFEAKFEAGDIEPLKAVASGSRVRLTGVYRLHYNENQSPEYFQILLRAPADVRLLERPSWWTPQRTAFALTLFSILSLGGAAWMWALARKNTDLREQVRERRRVESELQKAHAELEQRVRDRTAELSCANNDLKDEIAERKRAEAEVEKAHKQLLDTARQAGMADVATNVLHNVGNVLNSLNVSATLVAEGVRGSKVSDLKRLAKLLGEHTDDFAAFLADDKRGRQVPTYITQLVTHLTREHEFLLQEIQSLTENIGHIKQIVAMQQNYAKVSGILETIHPAELIENALLMNAGALVRHEITVVRDYEQVPPITVDKHKVLQILINLIGNAKYAIDENGPSERLLRLRLECMEGERIRISVIDTGIGIPKENLSRIFQHGFTTKRNGHGFGLHSSAIAATELGGSLNAQSDGVTLGATFVLELPIEMECEREARQHSCRIIHDALEAVS